MVNSPSISLAAVLKIECQGDDARINSLQKPSLTTHVSFSGLNKALPKRGFQKPAPSSLLHS